MILEPTKSVPFGLSTIDRAFLTSLAYSSMLNPGGNLIVSSRGVEGAGGAGACAAGVCAAGVCAITDEQTPAINRPLSNARIVAIVCPLLDRGIDLSAEMAQVYPVWPSSLTVGGIMIVPGKTPHQWVSIKNNAFGPKEAIGYIAINMDDPR